MHLIRKFSALVACGLFITMSGQSCPQEAPLPSDKEPPRTISFSKDVQPIFNTHCIRCHVTGGFANNSGIPLKLIEGVSYDLLVGQHSKQNPDLYIVKPYDSDHSLLYQKISSPTPPVGRRMPWDAGTIVSDEEIEKIETWINEGAAKN